LLDYFSQLCVGSDAYRYSRVWQQDLNERVTKYWFIRQGGLEVPVSFIRVHVSGASLANVLDCQVEFSYRPETRFRFTKVK
jgi:hypothetical protein